MTEPNSPCCPCGSEVLNGAVHVRLHHDPMITVNDEGRITRIPLSQREVRAIVESAFLLGLSGVAS